MKSMALRLSFMLLMCFAVTAMYSCKKKDKDPEIRSTINSKVQTDASLAGVTATVHEGTVTLTGTCADENCRTNAEQSIKDIDGVKKVINNIQVAAVVITEDETIRNSLASVTNSYEGVQADVASGVITLRGTIENRQKLQELMAELNALRPKRIDNQLVIKNK